jgi:hypothetical protein
VPATEGGYGAYSEHREGEGGRGGEEGKAIDGGGSDAKLFDFASGFAGESLVGYFGAAVRSAGGFAIFDVVVLGAEPGDDYGPFEAFFGSSDLVVAE